jgi:hypothetical protein
MAMRRDPLSDSMRNHAHIEMRGTEFLSHLPRRLILDQVPLKDHPVTL